MLYLRFKNSNKRMYINVKEIGKILAIIGIVVSYFYLSKMDYLTLINK